MRLGVVGIDHFHTTGWVESFEHFADEIEIVALYDPDPEIGRTRAPRFHDPSLSPTLPPRIRNLPFYTDLGLMLAAERLDLALVTLSPRDGPAAIEQLAGAGVHMLVDKPVAKSAAEARRAFAAARKAGVKATVGLGKRVSLGWLDAKGMIESGRLGRILSAEAIFVTSSVAVRDPENHLFDASRSGHGILHWLGVHDVDALMWMTGEQIVEVQAMTANVLGAPIAVEDAISIAFRFSGGGLGTIHFVNAFPRPASDGYLAFRGEKGSVKISSDGDLTWIGPGTRENPVLTEERHYTVANVGGYGATALVEIADLLAAIREDRDPLITGEDLVRALEVIDAAYESAATARRVTIPWSQS
jgi:predicted dehydrogenase